MKIIKNNNFLQSSQWADFQEKLGRRVWRIDPVRNFISNGVDGVVVIKYPLPFGQSYLYCSAGPVFSSVIPAQAGIQLAKERVVKVDSRLPAGGHGFRGDDDSKVIQQRLENLIESLINLAKKENVIFLRLEPRFEIDLKKFGFTETAPVQPKNTLILDLQKSEEELLNGFHPKTRYNVRLAEKKGVKIRISTDQKDIEHFWQLIKQTTARDNFSSHPKDYYFKLAESKMLKIFIAEYENKVLAVNLMIFFGDTVTYLHGASADEGRNLMAPHLLQWAAIKEAKKFGCKYYDFWAWPRLVNPTIPGPV